MAEYDIGITCFFLNEQKFLPFSVRSFMESPAVKSVILVEGCVSGYPTDNVTKQGLSTDGSSEIAAELAKESPKVEYVPMGFVDGKRDLQNRGFHVIRARLGEAAIYMLAGADEVYHSHELVALQDCFKANPKAKIVLYPFYHFWWRPDLVATGSSWSVLMHRAYRRPGLPMAFAHHAAPPADCGKGPKIHAKKGGEYVCHCYHYVGMQDAPHIHAKLSLYHKRDGGRLKVTDTWSAWQWGERTQWTHDGGSVKRFDGKHPKVINPHVWNLTPRDLGGTLLPLPEVPWDGDGKSDIITPRKDVAIFLEGRTIPADLHVTGLIADLSTHHNVTIYTLDGELEEAGKYQVRKFKARDINRHHIVVLFPESFLLRPLGARHVAVLWKDLDFQIDPGGYVVYKLPGVKGDFPELPSVFDFVKGALALPIADVKKKPHRRAVVPDVSEYSVAGRAKGPIAKKLRVKITNITAVDWVKGTHFVGCFWATGKSTLLGRAPRTKGDLPKDRIKVGETMTCDVAVPHPPKDMENGFLQLCVDVLDQGLGTWLNVGSRIPVQIKNWRIFG